MEISLIWLEYMNMNDLTMHPLVCLSTNLYLLCYAVTARKLKLQEATAEARRSAYGCCEDDTGESKSASIPTSS